jgi:plasmid stabilization system protein ParE
MPWDKVVQPKFISAWSRLSLVEKSAIKEAIEQLALNPLKYQPRPVRLMNGDLLIVVRHYWIQYRLDERTQRVIFVRLRTD